MAEWTVWQVGQEIVQGRLVHKERVISGDATHTCDEFGCFVCASWVSYEHQRSPSLFFCFRFEPKQRELKLMRT